MNVDLYKLECVFRIRDANLAARGIDASDTGQQIKACEERGKELLKDYIAKKGEGRTVTREESESILEPLKGAFTLMENAMNMTGKYTNMYIFFKKGKLSKLQMENLNLLCLLDTIRKNLKHQTMLVGIMSAT